MARETEEACLCLVCFVYSCSLLRWIVKACAGCLGFSGSCDDLEGPPKEEDDGSDDDAKDPPEEEDDATDARVEWFTIRTRRSRRPLKPPPSEGNGGQIN